MGTCVALFLALTSPVQAGGKLDLGNVRVAHDALGPLREPAANLKILPGERFHYLFEIGGLKPDEAGLIRFATILEVVRKDDGKEILEKNTGEVFQAGIPGTKFRHSINLSTPLDMKPGTYKVTVLAEDLIGKGTGTFEREFTVEPMSFGLVALQYTYDKQRTLPAPSVGVVGQSINVHVIAVGLKVDDKAASGLDVKMEVFDENNKMIAAKPWTGEYRKFPAETLAWPFGFELPVQKPGTFKIVVTATDVAAKKTVTLTTYYTAVDVK